MSKKSFVFVFSSRPNIILTLSVNLTLDFSHRVSCLRPYYIGISRTLLKIQDKMDHNVLSNNVDVILLGLLRL